MYVNPSGEQAEICAGAWRAVVTQVGATLRELSCDGAPLIAGFPESRMADGGRGQVLVPWPNRIRDGRYRFGGVDLQLALTEPARRNAAHGLVRWSEWQVHERSAERVRLVHRLHPQPGYPFALDLDLSYSLSDAGLRVDLKTTNRSSTPAPFGAGFHPYLRAGSGPVDGWRLQVPAAVRLLTDDRMLPVGREEVAGSYDFRQPRLVGPLELDTCFAALESDRVVVEGDRRIELWMGPGFSHVMVFSGDGLPTGARMGLAVEPMTCAPDAFNSGEGLRSLAPGEGLDLSWGIHSPSK